MTEIHTRALEIKAQNPGWGYKRIAKEIGCSHNTIRHHFSEHARVGSRNRQSRNRKINVNALKMLHGGKCAICGYKKCLSALDFHHLDPTLKIIEISTAFRQNGKAFALLESKKCKLICANCHAEVHEGITKLEPTEEIASSFSPLPTECSAISA